MSHFAVIVIADDVGEALAPYQENNMGDCPQEYLEFQPEIDKADEEQAKQEIIKSWETREQKYREADHDEKLNFYKNATPKEVIEDYHSYDYSEENKAWGYWSNPNSMWDWYEVGGRWCGFFPCLKGMEQFAVKSRGHWGSRQPFPFGYDSIRRKAIDFEAFEDFYFNNAKKFCEKNKYKIQTGVFGSYYTDIQTVKENADMYVRALLIDEWEESESIQPFSNKMKPDWNAYLLNKIKEQDGEALITIVDCHI